MEYEEFKAHRLALILEAERAKWLELHLIIPDFENPGEWLVLEVPQDSNSNNFSKWL